MFKNYKKDHIKVQSYRIYLIFIVFVLLLFISVFSISCGVSEISFSTTLDAFFNFNPSNKDHLIILSIRLPRVIAAILIGSSLAISGAIMQGITRNSLADSGLMGINSGAGFALALCFVFFLQSHIFRLFLFVLSVQHWGHLWVFLHFNLVVILLLTLYWQELP